MPSGASCFFSPVATGLWTRDDDETQERRTCQARPRSCEPGALHELRSLRTQRQSDKEVRYSKYRRSRGRQRHQRRQRLRILPAAQIIRKIALLRVLRDSFQSRAQQIEGRSSYQNATCAQLPQGYASRTTEQEVNNVSTLNENKRKISLK